ncbi:MAG: tRNA lysidine(34) synthetase TilS [bacterium]|nr:tRNA lysidine(34) synthetase TilS [bacterium]
MDLLPQEQKLSPEAQKLLAILENNHLVPQGSKCLMGISGGSDSAAMLHLFCELRPRLNLKLAAAHIDHYLRDTSERDRLFTEKLCADNHVELRVLIANVKEKAAAEKISLEEAGRLVRYKFFRKVFQELDCDLLFTAHTADDQAETVLMRIISGTGINGLKGVARSRSKAIVRPLLNFSRSELRDYLKAHGHSWCEDETNLVPSATRTKIRLEVIPYLEKMNPRIKESLVRLAELSAIESRPYEKQASRLIKCFSKSHNCFSIPAQEAMKYPRPARARAFHKILAKLSCQAEYEHIMRIEAILEASARKTPSASDPARASMPARVSLPGLVSASVIKGVLHFARQQEPASDYSFPAQPGEYLIPGWGFTAKLEREPISARPQSHKIWLNPDTLPEMLTIRSRRDGDRFYPAGGQGSQKLKKYLNELGLPQASRDILPILACGNEIAWVIGYRADWRYLAKPGQTEVLSLEII